MDHIIKRIIVNLFKILKIYNFLGLVQYLLKLTFSYYLPFIHLEFGYHFYRIFQLGTISLGLSLIFKYGFI